MALSLQQRVKAIFARPKRHTLKNAPTSPAASTSASPPPPTLVPMVQLGICLPVPAQARYLSFRLRVNADAKPCIVALCETVTSPEAVIGFGPALISALGKQVLGLREFPALQGKHGVFAPSTPSALWVWLRGDDRGRLVLLSQQVITAVADAFELEAVVDGFKHGSGRDLTGFEDGTANPANENGERALDEACFVREGELRGSSFVAVQKWVHDFKAFGAMSEHAQSHVIGRDKRTNDELEDAPASAHVKRTDQEAFSPQAFVLRRSMPWADGSQAGLMFVAFGKSFDAYEAQLRKMLGLEDDGVVDALFGFTRPVTGSFYWCPPVVEGGRLDLSRMDMYW